MAAIKYIVICPLGYKDMVHTIGDTAKTALDELIKEYGDDVDLKEAVFYEAKKCNLRVDTSPIIVSTE